MKLAQLKISVVLLVAIGCVRPAHAQLLETESARLLPRGGIEAGSNFEYQTSGEGSESAVPLFFEVGISNRIELTVEPVVRTAIRPKNSTQATGAGDIEVTGTWLARQETHGFPALAFAGEVKFPTARNPLIGTGAVDVAGYLILSKHFGRLDTWYNLSYTFVGQPPGVQLNNIFGFAAAAVWTIKEKNWLFAEVLGNTAATSTPESVGPVPPSGFVPEAAGGELVGTLGVARFVTSSLQFAFSASIDNQGALLFRPGFMWRIRGGGRAIGTNPNHPFIGN